MNYFLYCLFFPLLLSSLGCQNLNPSTANKSPSQEDSLALNSSDASSKPIVRSPLMVSRDYGSTWMNIDEGLAPNAEASFIESKGEEMVLATDNQGIYLSQNNRTQWKAIGKDLPNQKINALHVGGESIFAGVYRAGIFETRDEGKNWESLNFDLPNLSVQAILQVQDELWLGTDSGIFKLAKGSKNWESTEVNAQVLSLYAYEGRMIAGTSLGTLLSNDQGATWDWIRKAGAVHYTHNIGSRIIELVLNGDLFYSDDWGQSWQEMSYQPRKGSYVYEIASLGDYWLMSNNYGIHRSADQGNSWDLIFPTEEMGFFDFLVMGNEIYGGTRAWDEYRERRK